MTGFPPRDARGPNSGHSLDTTSTRLQTASRVHELPSWTRQRSPFCSTHTRLQPPSATPTPHLPRPKDTARQDFGAQWTTWPQEKKRASSQEGLGLKKAWPLCQQTNKATVPKKQSQCSRQSKGSRFQKQKQRAKVSNNNKGQGFT